MLERMLDKSADQPVAHFEPLFRILIATQAETGDLEAVGASRRLPGAKFREQRVQDVRPRGRQQPRRAEVLASAETERQRLADQRRAEAEAARTSPLLVRLASAPPPPKAPTTIDSARPGTPGLLADAGRNAGQQRKIDFMGAGLGDANRQMFVAAPSPWTLSAGTVIPASLITGINSDLPGIVLAQVTQQVRDSATGTAVLIPQGSRLIGNYDSMVDFGQKRALIAWQRIIFPDGSSVRLDNMPAADLAGYAGLEDKVEFHEWRWLKGIALSTLLGIGSELSLGSEDSDLARALERSVQRDGERAGDQLVSRNLDVQQTLKIRPGWPVRAIVYQDLVLKPWEG